MVRGQEAGDPRVEIGQVCGGGAQRVHLPPRLRPTRQCGDIIRYQPREVTVADVLIRDVPDGVLVAIDARARRLGLSRSEYLRRQLAREAETSDGDVTVNDLRRFADTFTDLADPDVMRRAWE
ncbi:MAG: type II toxin-antitoxin system VapB family antitoxin [Pseudonocardiaceae bacterium]